MVSLKSPDPEAAPQLAGQVGPVQSSLAARPQALGGFAHRVNQRPLDALSPRGNV